MFRVEANMATMKPFRKALQALGLKGQTTFLL